ncbi:MAG: hypothetical protein OQJ96_01415 [Flavobacteriales bacterium]|nr:hypothetical protein [Flavobacteriales bacterium]MCW8912581.1 hypothetical protein [Flavobacteriales bacterium]MCW8938186.1 hypothetical protein [Flavobacteriales bacterium]MCW8941018.1 hypothetical protein [Flavobacteriales bacterium]MCW8967022.1 hypothetical protein [Flavobacteriales bacterium]
MKKLNLYMLIIITATAYLSTSCSKDDKKDTPQPVQQEDPMAYMTIEFLETNIVGVWVSDSAFNTSSTGYYNEAYVDTVWFTQTQYSWDNINYVDSYFIDEFKSLYFYCCLNTNPIYDGTIEYISKSGLQMNYVTPPTQNLPNFNKRVVRYFKQ